MSHVAIILQIKTNVSCLVKINLLSQIVPVEANNADRRINPTDFL